MKKLKKYQTEGQYSNREKRIIKKNKIAKLEGYDNIADRRVKRAENLHNVLHKLPSRYDSNTTVYGGNSNSDAAGGSSTATGGLGGRSNSTVSVKGDNNTDAINSTNTIGGGQNQGVQKNKKFGGNINNNLKINKPMKKYQIDGNVSVKKAKANKSSYNTNSQTSNNVVGGSGNRATQKVNNSRGSNVNNIKKSSVGNKTNSNVGNTRNTGVGNTRNSNVGNSRPMLVRKMGGMVKSKKK